MALKVPRISQAEIASFHEAHFSASAIVAFRTDFFPIISQDHTHPIFHGQLQECEDQSEGNGQTWAEDDYEEDDGLGYYADGVKRTLTDEQIEIFRHSEVEALRRGEDKAAKLRHQSAELHRLARSNAEAEHDDIDAGELVEDGGGRAQALPSCSKVSAGAQRSGSEDGELEDDGDGTSQHMTEAEAKRLKKKRARQRKQANKNKKFNPKPKMDLRKRTWDVVDAGMDSLDYDELEGVRAPGSGVASKRRQISYDD
ncbi:hypothetical protein Micbo1qcDRAFT_63472 [Microdochium bolleyi]|uniref:Uncharacterized protein n=1 Tax=Microdochium bolleyi TaxID=196109 RepID=A0A136J1U6_9PEZI|nr:hypothetical protein Micbo1qcDRAFT_63472 [Microdochium bolleyi]